MSKKFRDQPFRGISDSSGKLDWLRDKGRGHAGFSQLFNPGRKAVKRFAAEVDQAERKARAREASKRFAKGSAAQSRRRAASRMTWQPSAAHQVAVAPIVPLPDEKTPAPCAPPREGQFEFRAMVLAAYGSRCAITGCEDEEALEAAHIIPFVDQRSHKIENGLCLRADIHALYDKGLLRIGQDCVVSVADAVKSREYRALAGAVLLRPDRDCDAPCPRLLALHERFTGSNTSR